MKVGGGHRGGRGTRRLFGRRVPEATGNDRQQGQDRRGQEGLGGNGISESLNCIGPILGVPDVLRPGFAGIRLGTPPGSSAGMFLAVEVNMVAGQ